MSRDCRAGRAGLSEATGSVDYREGVRGHAPCISDVVDLVLSRPDDAVVSIRHGVGDPYALTEVFINEEPRFATE